MTPSPESIIIVTPDIIVKLSCRLFKILAANECLPVDALYVITSLHQVKRREFLLILQNLMATLGSHLDQPHSNSEKEDCQLILLQIPQNKLPNISPHHSCAPTVHGTLEQKVLDWLKGQLIDNLDHRRVSLI
jgi:hypothetical protein